MTASLEQFFTDNFASTEDEISEAVKYFKHVKATKDEVLLKNGDVCRYFFFIVKGCLKTSFIDDKGQDSDSFRKRTVILAEWWVRMIGTVGQLAAEYTEGPAPGYTPGIDVSLPHKKTKIQLFYRDINMHL